MPHGRLLILDDDAATGNTVRLIAESAGLTARLATDPADFFRTVIDWRPTHIALDLVMPAMDGVEVLAQLAQRHCPARIIITSGVGHRVLEAAGRSAVEHGLDIAGVLPKPFSPKALRSLLVAMPAAETAAVESAVRTLPSTSATAAAPFEVTAAEVQRALDERELYVVYEPKVECASGALAGFEALVRWRHPQQGTIPPARFVPVAETHGLIDRLTSQVLEQAIAWFREDFCAGDRRSAVGRCAVSTSPISLSVNISARTLKDPQFVERLIARCDRYGMGPGRLILELTETSAMEDPVAALDLLTRLRMKGFLLSIDDFGTGFSSLLQLVRLPFSEIKIDSSFVMTAMQSAESRTAVKSVVDLGHSLGLCVVAEGVEDAQTLEYLKRIGCDQAQGYFFARPMEKDVISDWIARRR
ncbi:MAG: EAL domain-containing response regulator [Gammaproteobacteria bacterium]|nr:EAL domain-containing response regulator [Gammaproteobacteria bacterium]